jgi:hypothetical protein
MLIYKNKIQLGFFRYRQNEILIKWPPKGGHFIFRVSKNEHLKSTL